LIGHGDVTFLHIAYVKSTKNVGKLACVFGRFKNPFFLWLIQILKAVTMIMATAIAFFWSFTRNPAICLFACHQVDDPRMKPLALPYLLNLHANPPASLVGNTAFSPALQNGWVEFISPPLNLATKDDVDAFFSTPEKAGHKEALGGDSLTAVCVNLIKAWTRETAGVMSQSKDFDGRKAIEVDVPAIKAALHDKLLFLGRYQLLSVIHKSATCVIYKTDDFKAADDDRALFQKCLKDGRTTIGKKDLQEILVQHLGLDYNDDHLGTGTGTLFDDAFKAWDGNGDGTISEDEFVELASKRWTTADPGGPFSR
jgi:hypothetical protein